MPIERKAFVEKIQAHVGLVEAARVATNEAARSKTECARWLREYMKDNSYPPSYALGVDNFEVSLSVAAPRRVPSASEVLRMYKDGEINENQLLQIMYIGKDDADRVLGADVVEGILEEVPGKVIDVRIKKTENDVVYETPTDLYVQVKKPSIPPKQVKTLKRLVRLPPKLARVL